MYRHGSKLKMRCVQWFVSHMRDVVSFRLQGEIAINLFMSCSDAWSLTQYHIGPNA